MNTAKRLIGAVVLATATSLGALTASAADLANLQAGDIIELNLGNRSSGPGGEFVASLYSPSTTPAANSFVTFCLEKTEYFNPGAPLTVLGISAYATAGGGGAVAGKDFISAQTAWLYTQFRAGALSGYGGSNIANDADALQNVFWFLENEITSVTSGLSGLATTVGTEAYWATTWLAAANAAVAGSWGNTIGNVRVMNLQNANGSRAQDQLYIAPIPEPEIYAMMVAGLGLMGFVARRRKQYGVA